MDTRPIDKQQNDSDRTNPTRLRDDASARELERHIDRTRNRLETSISELERRVSPEAMISQFLGPIRQGGTAFGSNLAERIKSNPTPMLLTAAGVLWMMMSDRSAAPRYATPSHPDRYSNELDGASSESPMARIGDAVKESAGAVTGTVAKMKDQASSAAESVSRSVQSGAAAGRDSIDDLSTRLRIQSSSAQRTISRSSQQLGAIATDVSAGTRRLFHEQPVSLGLVGMAVGALFGALLPPTRREDELIGPHRDRLTSIAQEEASAQLGKAKEAAASKAAEVAEKAQSYVKDASTKL